MTMQLYNKDGLLATVLRPVVNPGHWPAVLKFQGELYSHKQGGFYQHGVDPIEIDPANVTFPEPPAPVAADPVADGPKDAEAPQAAKKPAPAVPSKQ